MNKTIGLVWLNNNYRLHDNDILIQGANHCDELIIANIKFSKPIEQDPCYTYEQAGLFKETFKQETLADFNAALQRLGNRLIRIACVDISTLASFIQTHGVSDIFYTQAPDFNSIRRSHCLKKSLPKLRWHYAMHNTLFGHFPLDTLPEVFTQFRKKVETNDPFKAALTQETDTPEPNALPPLPDSLDGYDINPSHPHTHGQNTYCERPFRGGEVAALEHLEHYFASDAPQSYKITRNALDNWHDSTKFSPWLANGALSVRRLLKTLRRYEQTVVSNESTYWILFELLWREYFQWYAYKHKQRLFLLGGIHRKTLLRSFYPERFEQWKNGSTAYPIVNACMNQLRATGYMSNRGRQLVASCFIHELDMDWRYGAHYFEQQLIDYDVASNWGNWQYLAGVGADPRGSRRFNLLKQTQQYDPDGAFIKRWHGEVNALRIDSADVTD